MKGEILIVDDSATDREALRRMVEKSTELDLPISEAETGEEALVMIDDSPIRCILLDYHLPDMNCLDFMNMAIIPREVAIIILTSVGDERVPIEAMKRGAHDFLRKDNLSPELLEHAILHSMDRASAAHRERSYRDRLELLHGLLEQSDQLLMVINLKQEVIVELNECARRLIGVEKKEAMNYAVPVAEAFTASTADWRNLRAQTAVTDAGRLETELKAGNRRFPVEVNARRVNVGVNEYHTAVVRDLADQRKLQRELDRVLHHDPLTGLFNADGLRNQLQEFWRLAVANDEVLGLLMVGINDLDSFAAAGGEEAADECRKRIAVMLEKRGHRYNECLTRYDRDRFAILTRGLDASALSELVRRVHTDVAQLVRVHPATSGFVTVTAADVCAPAGELDDPDKLLELAEGEMMRRGWAERGPQSA